MTQALNTTESAPESMPRPRFRTNCSVLADPDTRGVRTAVRDGFEALIQLLVKGGMVPMSIGDVPVCVGAGLSPSERYCCSNSAHDVGGLDRIRILVNRGASQWLSSRIHDAIRDVFQSKRRT